jgi:hypothetical protein
MRVLRLPFLLLVLLALTGTGVLQARAAGDGTQMVLCAGGVLKTVYLDAEGNPAPPPHDCPDCHVVPVAALPDADPGATRAAPAPVRAVRPAAICAHAAAPRLAFSARAPPVPI